MQKLQTSILEESSRWDGDPDNRINSSKSSRKSMRHFNEDLVDWIRLQATGFAQNQFQRKPNCVLKLSQLKAHWTQSD